MAADRIALRVGDADAGSRLDRFLADPLGSRARAQRQIDSGRVTVDGRPSAKSHVVAPGELVEVEPEIVEADAAPVDPAPFRIAYEDDYLLVVDKPAGVVVHPARGHPEGTLSQALAGLAAGGEAQRAGIVHRLDRDTSGLLVVARSESVHRALRSLLSSRRLHREYLALVAGHPSARSGTIDAPVGRDRRDRLAMSIDTDAPREARTHFDVEELMGGAALLRVTLETGRTHQIRVHLAAIGLPVCGDPVYGVPGAYGLERQFLHAARLAFEHPVTHEALDVRSPLPEDLAEALERARRGKAGKPA
ncbi:MAG TPA: RluA family pseudouridine synthase [Solirubrobacteraceae bacterium]|jgi:23S rRNA pseudouridine1911/1915/1917 synthase